MGYYTQLLFNKIDVPREQLAPLRDSGREALKDKTCEWSYFLNHLYVESSEEEVIDFGLSEGLTKHLIKTYRKRVVSLDEVLSQDMDEEEEAWYQLGWAPYEYGPVGKWYDSDKFAEWLATFCSCGQLYQVTEEDEGGMWGWGFEDGQFCELELCMKGDWKPGRPFKKSKRKK